MFTGIVDHCGKIESIKRLESSLDLKIQTEFKDFDPGESISVDGVCLTVTEFDASSFQCQVSIETLEKSIVSQYQEGQIVNLERSLCLGDRMGGHFVSGHIDRTATVAAKDVVGDYVRFAFRGFAPEQMRYLVPKGSVGINGVSLTINAVMDDGFEIMLIPHTLEVTNLSELEVGSTVNIEFDWMCKILLHDLEIRRKHLEASHV